MPQTNLTSEHQVDSFQAVDPPSSAPEGQQREKATNESDHA